MGTVTSGTWEGTAVGDSFVVNDLTITDGTVNSTVIGGTTPAAGTFTSVTSTGGVQANGTLSLDDGTATIAASELNVLDGVTPGTVTSNKALVVDSNKDISGIRNVTASGLVMGGSLDIDDVLVDGSTIGHTDDGDLLTLASGLVTVAGEISDHA